LAGVLDRHAFAAGKERKKESFAKCQSSKPCLSGKGEEVGKIYLRPVQKFTAKKGRHEIHAAKLERKKKAEKERGSVPDPGLLGKKKNTPRRYHTRGKRKKGRRHRPGSHQKHKGEIKVSRAGRHSLYGGEGKNDHGGNTSV